MNVEEFNRKYEGFYPVLHNGLYRETGSQNHFLAGMDKDGYPHLFWSLTGSEWEEKRTVGRIRCNVLERGHLLMKRAIRPCRVQHVHFREGVAARATHCEGGKERAKELRVDIG